MSGTGGTHTVYLAATYTPLATGQWEYCADGCLVVDAAGRIVARGDRAQLAQTFAAAAVVDCRGRLICPGLVDCHQHLSHYEWIRSVPDLFEWLRCIYALEAGFAEPAHARRIANAFFRELVRNGTTTCCVHGPYFPDATHAAFEEAAQSGMRVLMGMNMGDLDLPAELTRSPAESLRWANSLHAAWSGQHDGLLDYVYTVRPAYCASEYLLRGVGERAHSAGVRVQSHLGESATGRDKIRQEFPGLDGETAVYDACGLLSSRTLMAHGVYVTDAERSILAARGLRFAHCPRANLLAGGRQMSLRDSQKAGIAVGLGTELGEGKGLSLFRTMEDALKVTPGLCVHDVFRLATLGGAAALGLDARTGSLEVGKDADFLVVSPKCTHAEPGIEDMLSALVFRGDDRNIERVFVRGREVATQC
jgi:guanine deaminase